ncbi:oleate hydratase [Streptomyces beijiangensis]|uniref:Oleate hydratase n=1 Tax=Streptomyces beijiangensis TaxID=163361 RepID=A0A939JEL8_9ACTN|nr:oleate hydratase [Streptomyces beijiangensis]MBO0513211.1 oleate hydratase [Streptomyces beijiangensis]
MSGIYRTRFHQYASVVPPRVKWLKDKGVAVRLRTRVADAGVHGLGDPRRSAPDTPPTLVEMTVTQISFTLNVPAERVC